MGTTNRWTWSKEVKIRGKGSLKKQCHPPNRGDGWLMGMLPVAYRPL
jgi:hypothetical protein